MLFASIIKLKIFALEAKISVFVSDKYVGGGINCFLYSYVLPSEF